MYYGTIKNFDVADGPGCRVSLFVSGCRNHCPGCFNRETWDFGYGREYTGENGHRRPVIASLISPQLQVSFFLITKVPKRQKKQGDIPPKR